MTEPLHSAFRLAERINFTDSTAKEQIQSALLGEDFSGPKREEFLKTAMRIDPAVTPGLANTISTVCQGLKIPAGHVEAYVSASSEIQARCFSFGRKCILHLTSGTVNLMQPGELSFVVGHEVGHWLLRHGSANCDRGSRAQEIAADRIGRIACGSMEHATHAMMKSTSGLSSEHIRFDVGRFLEQLEDVGQFDTGLASTHPANLVRCKALVIFDIAVRQGLTETALQAANSQVRFELKRFQNGHEERLIKQYKMWVVMHHIVSSQNRFSKENQRAFETYFGPEALESMKGFLGLSDTSNLLGDIEGKVETIAGDLSGFDLGAIRQDARNEILGGNG
jgi:hypothetical protein